MNRMFTYKMIVLLSVLMIQSAQALTVVRAVNQSKPDELEFTLDQPVAQGDVNLDIFKDLVQLTLNQVSLYPAKIINPENQRMKKIFAYQYSPQVVRTRISVLGEENELKKSVKLSVEGKKIKLTVLTKQIAAEAPTAISSNTATQTTNVATAAASTQGVSKTQIAKSEGLSKTNLAIASQKAKDVKKETSLLRPIMVIFGFFSVLGVGILILFYFKNGKQNKAIAKFLGFKNLIGKKNNKMIDVVANHYLGPKKSIMVVKIKGKLFVLGMSDGAMNLITELESEDELDSVLDATFTDEVFKQPSVQPKITSVSSQTNAPLMQATKAAQNALPSQLLAQHSAPKNSFFDETLESEKSTSKIREKIRSKVQGLKTL